MKKILYISYDGLTDPLGQSQILPYLTGLSKHGFQFTILSFEKKNRFHKEKDLVGTIINRANIKWVPLWFTARPPILSKIYDRWQLKKTALKLHRREKFDMIHCRSYVAAEIGLLFKKRFGTKFLFDMRGFWADEKKDAGAWNQSSFFFRQVYKYYKRKEAEYLRKTDCVVSLTESGKKEMMRWSSYNPLIPIAVIPTCADMDVFNLTDDEQKRNSRQRLGIQNGALVISYLGSIGTWYMLDEMLLFFKGVKTNFPSAKFLFITPESHSVVDQKIRELELDKNDFIITSAARKEVPLIAKASDINVSFIKPVYSKISSSPTKLGEILSMGIPIICNGGVGDVESTVKKADAGFVLNGFTAKDFEAAVNAVHSLLKKSPPAIRDAIKDMYSLENGIQLYLSCYRQILE